MRSLPNRVSLRFVLDQHSPSGGDINRRVANRFIQAAAANDLPPLLDEIVKLHEQVIKPWIGRFDQVLMAAERDSTDLPTGWVRQTEFVAYLNQFDDQLSPKMRALRMRIEKVWVAIGREEAANDLTYNFDDIVFRAQAATAEPGHKARLAHAISNIDFAGDDIIYKIGTLQEWADAFRAWCENSIVAIKAANKKAKQRIQRLKE